MRYLITGGCGFVGCNIAARLLAEHAEVFVLDNLSREGSADNLAWLRSTGLQNFARVDIRYAEDVGTVLAQFRPDVIFHLAGQVAMTTSLADPRLDFEVNALGTINVLEEVRRHVPRAVVVYSSSNKVYGDLHTVAVVEGATRYDAPAHPNGVDENAPLEFHTPYGCSKGAAEQYVLDYSRVFGLTTMVLRYSTIYGGRQFATYDQGWVTWFCRQALETAANPGRAPFTISGDGKQVRDLLYVDDAVDCYLACARNADRASGHAFNIGGGIANSSSLLELFAVLESRLGVPLVFERLPWRTSDQRFFVADNTKAGLLLGWHPRTDKRDGIERTLTWMREALANDTPYSRAVASAGIANTAEVAGERNLHGGNGIS